MFGGNWALEAFEASEVAEATEVNEAGEVSKVYPPLCIAGALLPFARPPFCCEPFGEACKEASAFVSVLVALRVACTVFMSSTSSSFL